MVALLKQFVLRFVLHNETDKQRGAERGQHKQDVAADVVKGIENIFAEHGNVFPRAIAQNGRDVAEMKMAANTIVIAAVRRILVFS